MLNETCLLQQKKQLRLLVFKKQWTNLDNVRDNSYSKFVYAKQEEF